MTSMRCNLFSHVRKKKLLNILPKLLYYRLHHMFCIAGSYKKILRKLFLIDYRGFAHSVID